MSLIGIRIPLGMDVSWHTALSLLSILLFALAVFGLGVVMWDAQVHYYSVHEWAQNLPVLILPAIFLFFFADGLA